MKIKPALAAKIKKCKALEKEYNSLWEEIRSTITRLDEQNADVCIEDFYISDRAAGQAQGDGEFCDQWSGYIEDDYEGVYYYPIEGSEKYVAVKYHC